MKKVFTEVRNTLDPGSSVSPIDFCVVRLLGSDGFRSIPSSLFSREQLCSPAVLPSGLLLKLLSFWGGALQPPPLFESGKAANFVVIALAWGILWNRLSAKLEQASPGHVMPRPRNWTLRGSLASFIPSLYQDDESASEDQCSSESDAELNVPVREASEVSYVLRGSVVQCLPRLCKCGIM